jgi:hypothetical protein
MTYQQFHTLRAALGRRTGGSIGGRNSFVGRAEMGTIIAKIIVGYWRTIIGMG